MKGMWKHIASVLALSAVCLCSCEKIYDYEGDCDPHWQVKFVYDYNMKFADAFPGPMGVGSVRLYVFDAASGRLVLEKDAVAGPGGFGKDYVMPVEDLTPGRYRFVAWCGWENNPAFAAARPRGRMTLARRRGVCRERPLPARRTTGGSAPSTTGTRVSWRLPANRGRTR